MALQCQDHGKMMRNQVRRNLTSMFKLMNLSPWTFAGLCCDWKWLHNDYKILWRGWRLKWKGFHCTTTLMEPFGTWYSNLLHTPHCVGCRGAEKAGGGMCAPCHLRAPGQVSDGCNGVMKRALLEERGKAFFPWGALDTCLKNEEEFADYGTWRVKRYSSYRFSCEKRYHVQTQNVLSLLELKASMSWWPEILWQGRQGWLLKVFTEFVTIKFLFNVFGFLAWRHVRS